MGGVAQGLYRVSGSESLKCSGGQKHLPNDFHQNDLDHRHPSKRGMLASVNFQRAAWLRATSPALGLSLGAESMHVRLDVYR